MKIQRLYVSIVIAFGVIGIVAFAALAQSPGERTRGLVPAEQILRVPLSGVDVNQIDWSQIGAMLAVLASISGGFQWLITRLIVQPQIAKELKEAITEIKAWGTKEFPSSTEFQLHGQADKNAQHEIAVALGETADVLERIRKWRDHDYNDERQGITSKVELLTFRVDKLEELIGNK